jgi:DNA modification methylase
MTPSYVAPRFTLYAGDSLAVLPTLAASSVDSVVSDPPYGLSFMGKEWDHGVPGEPFWREALRVAKPGAHLLAFGGTRTFHRLAVAIEDAGWEIRDCIMWVYGSGFPKSLDVSKAIDRKRDDHQDIVEVVRFLEQARIVSGVTRKQVEEHFGTVNIGQAFFTLTPGSQPRVPMWDQWLQLKHLLGFGDEMDAEVWRLNGRKKQPGDAWAEREVVGTAVGGIVPDPSRGERHTVGGHSREYVLTAPATEAAKAWAGWGTALKPAWEPVIVARKPLEGTVADNVLQHGTGAINVDACRIESDDGFEKAWDLQRIIKILSNKPTGGRWPANFIHDGSEEPTSILGDAARFFYSAKADADDRNDGGIRNPHPTVKPTDLMRYLVRMVTPLGGVVLDPFMGSGSTGRGAIAEGCRFVGIDLSPEFVEIARARIEVLAGEPSMFDPVPTP